MEYKTTNIDPSELKDAVAEKRKYNVLNVKDARKVALSWLDSIDLADAVTYLLLQRQFEMPGRGYCYVEDHELSPCGHFVAKAVLNQNEFQLYVSSKVKGNWNISFDIDDDNYEEVKAFCGLFYPLQIIWK